MTTIWHKRLAPFGVIVSVNRADFYPVAKVMMRAWLSPQRFGEWTRRRAAPPLSPIDLTLQRPFDTDADYATPNKRARGQICVSQP